MSVTGTDLDIECTAVCDVEDASRTAAFVLNPGNIRRFLSDISGPVRVIKGEHITIEGDGCALTKRDIFDPVEWPGFKGAKEAVDVEICEADLFTAIDACQCCVSTEQTRYYLNGIFLHKHPDADTARLVATDGRRLCRYDLDAAFPHDGGIIPKKTVSILKRSLRKGGNQNVKMSWAPESCRAIFSTPSGTIKTKLIDGTFPDYTRVIPTKETTIAAVVGETAIKRAMSASQLYAPLTFSFEKQVIIGGDASGDRVSVPIQITAPTETKDFGFNGNYLEQLCRAGGGTIKLEGCDPHEPFTALSEDSRALWVQMPMRV